MFVSVKIQSIYKNKSGQQVLMPERMAKVTPDMYSALKNLEKQVEDKGGKLILSDLFRSYDMQYQANLDTVTGKKKAYSPPPGGSMHEAGRAMDIDLSAIKMHLLDFWNIAKPLGFMPIISEPNPHLSECWHFDFRGSHQLIYDYYTAMPRNSRNMKPYEAMAASSITDHDTIPFTRNIGNVNVLKAQCRLVRLGYTNIGLLDGVIGSKTKTAITLAGGNPNNIIQANNKLHELLKIKFPNEYKI